MLRLCRGLELSFSERSLKNDVAKICAVQREVYFADMKVAMVLKDGTQPERVSVSRDFTHSLTDTKSQWKAMDDLIRKAGEEPNTPLEQSLSSRLPLVRTCLVSVLA